MCSKWSGVGGRPSLTHVSVVGVCATTHASSNAVSISARSRVTCSGVEGMSESGSVKLLGEHDRFFAGSEAALTLKSSSILLQLLVEHCRPLVHA